MHLTDLSDDELLSGLTTFCGKEQRLLAQVIAYLAEVEERRLHLKAACSSLFDFCVRRLGMSEGEAFRRITAARLSRRFPSVLGRIARGEIHLSALVLLRDHLTEANHEGLIAAASGKSKRAVQELVAARFPRPDVASTIRKLPSPAPEVTPATTAPSTSVVSSELAQPSAPSMPLTLSTLSPPSTVVAAATTHAPRSTPRPVAQLEPLSAARYRLQLTASAELRDKLERATELMRHRNPAGDFAVVIERALDLLITELEKERLGKTTRPHTKTRTRTRTRTRAQAAHADRITQATRRAVFERDGEQCAFVDREGRRCPSRSFLEIDHVHPRALGGGSKVQNLQILCRAHNQLRAEQTFGREHVARQIHLRQRASARSPRPQ